MVDLPAPLAPTKPTRSPSATRKSSPTWAAARPPGYAKLTPSKATLASAVRRTSPCHSMAGRASSSSKIPCAADSPTSPSCSRVRRSRCGRNASVPAISTISSTSMGICPSCTRHAPTASTAAAPTAMPVSVMPRVSEFVASTHIVLRNTSCAFSASSRPRARLWPKALSVASPWIASRNSAAKALYASRRRSDDALSHFWNSDGASHVIHAKASSSAASGTSNQASIAHTTSGVIAATNSCGR